VMVRSSVRWLAIALALAVPLMGCGVEPDDEARTISADAVPAQLRDEPENTTTSTTTPPSNLTRNEVFYLVKREAQDSTSWTLEPQTVSFEVPNQQRNEEIPRLLLEELIRARSLEARRLSNAVPADLEVLNVAIRVDENVIEVDFDEALSDSVTSGALTQAMAQIVFTLTGIRSTTPLDGGVRFFIEGEPIAVQTEAGEVPAGQPVDRDDFPRLKELVTLTTGDQAE
jgi:spore germination protein GerM